MFMSNIMIYSLAVNVVVNCIGDLYTVVQTTKQPNRTHTQATHGLYITHLTHIARPFLCLLNGDK